MLWDTLAIAETLAERHPETALWPAPLPARAMARTLAAEMHSSFTALRSACPMNLRRSYRGFAPGEGVQADLARIEALWALARAAHGAGGTLALRRLLAGRRLLRAGRGPGRHLRPADGEAAMDYVAAHLADPAFLAWRREGLADPFVQEHYDLDLPERPWPGPA